MRPTYKHFDNPFNSVLEHSLYSSYNYYRRKYPKIKREDIIDRCIETRINPNYLLWSSREKKETEREKPPEDTSPFDPPDEPTIHEDINYIYYKDKVWSKDRFKLITFKYYPRLKKRKAKLHNIDRTTHFTYILGTIPTYGQ
jgi:hypothetical protein